MAAVGGVETFGKFTFFWPRIDIVSAKAYEDVVEEWMTKRLFKYAKLYNDLTESWQPENQPVWKLDKILSSPLTVALLTSSRPFVWLDEGDDGASVTRKVRVNPASGATKTRKFGRAGPSKTVMRSKKGKKQFFEKGKYRKIRPRKWSQELIRRETKALAGNRPYFSRSKITPGVLYALEQLAFAPRITDTIPGGKGYKLKTKSFKY